MGKAKAKGAAGARKAWWPLAVAGVAVLAGVGLFSAPQASDAPSPRALAELEQQVSQIAVSMRSLAKGGDSGAFGTMGKIADAFESALAAAEKETDKAAKRRILEKALAEKDQYLGEFAQRAEDLGSAPGADGAVVELGASTFPEFLGDHDRALVAFVAPWCPHCKRLQPEFAAAAGEFQGKVAFGVVDATAERSLAQVFDVQGYPTLRFFNRGEPCPFEPARSRQELSAGVRAAMDLALTELEEPELEALFAAAPAGGRLVVARGPATADAKALVEKAMHQARTSVNGLFLWASSSDTSLGIACVLAPVQGALEYSPFGPGTELPDVASLFAFAKRCGGKTDAEPPAAGSCSA